jgi:hypothetical protein
VPQVLDLPRAGNQISDVHAARVAAIKARVAALSNRCRRSMTLPASPVGGSVHRKARACALHAMVSAVVVAGALVASGGSAVAQTDLEKQAQCELSFIRDTRSPLAVQYIRSACNWLVLNGDSLLNERNKGYYLCLVQQLSGAQGNEAAAAIVSACRTSNPLW